jgi:5-methylthioadenosine/S-adenosylhomocysteine deaminase
MTTTCIRNAAWVAAWNADKETHRYLRNADVVFAGNTITFVGTGYAGACDEEIDGRDLFVMPGLIDIHTHCMSEPVGKGIVEEVGNPKLYMSGLYDPKPLFLAAHSMDLKEGQQEALKAATTVAYSELLMSGVTTVADLSMIWDGWLDLMADSGIRGYAAPMYRSARWVTNNGHAVGYEWDEEAGKHAFKEAADFIATAETHPCGRLGAMVVPAQIDTCTAELLRDSLSLAQENGWPFQVHTSQSVVEFHEMTRRTGLTPIQWANEIGILGPNTILSHAIFIDEHSWVHWPTRDDVNLMAESGTSVAHCPSVVARYGQTMQNLGRYIRAGVNMGLGTDSFPHNLIDEMRWAVILGRVAAEDIEALRTGDVFHAATVGGAKALLRDDIGRLAPGAKADLVLIDLTHPSMRPLRDPIRSLVYTALERPVRDVYVDGAKVVENGRILTLDYASALDRLDVAQRAAEEGVPLLDYAKRTARQVSPLTLPLDEE